jgi:hypothetical protein
MSRGLGGPQGRSGRVRKILPPPGFDPRTVQPLASRYTEWAIAAHTILCILWKTNFVAFGALWDCFIFVPLLYLKLLATNKRHWEAGELSRYRELRCGLADRTIAARLPADARDLCLLHCVQTDSGGHKSGGPPSLLLSGDRQKSLSEVKRL